MTNDHGMLATRWARQIASDFFFLKAADSTGLFQFHRPDWWKSESIEGGLVEALNSVPIALWIRHSAASLVDTAASRTEWKEQRWQLATEARQLGLRTAERLRIHGWPVASGVAQALGEALERRMAEQRTTEGPSDVDWGFRRWLGC